MHESRNGALESKLAKEILSHKKNQAAQEAAMEKVIKDYESKIYNLQTTISVNNDVINQNGNHVFFFVQKKEKQIKKKVKKSFLHNVQGKREL